MKATNALIGLMLTTALTLGGPARSADAVDHASHHAGTTAPAKATTTVGGGMMSGMGQNNSMMGGDMMSMMGRMMPMVSGMMSSHTEDRLNFIRSGLKITAEQSAAWDHYAEAYRAAAMSMHSAMGSMMGMMLGDLPSRMAAHEKMMQAHLDALKSIEGPLTTLYTALTPDQKKAADDLIGMGM